MKDDFFKSIYKEIKLQTKRDRLDILISGKSTGHIVHFHVSHCEDFFLGGGGLRFDLFFVYL